MDISVCSDVSKDLAWPVLLINCMLIILSLQQGHNLAVSDWLYFKIFDFQQEKNIELQKEPCNKLTVIAFIHNKPDSRNHTELIC